MAAMKPATANGNTCVEEGTGCPDEVLYQTPDGTGVIAHGFQKSPLGRLRLSAGRHD